MLRKEFRDRGQPWPLPLVVSGAACFCFARSFRVSLDKSASILVLNMSEHGQSVVALEDQTLDIAGLSDAVL